MRWRDEDTCIFVKLYLKHENLWDRNHDLFRVREKREESYKKITSEFTALTGIRIHEPETKLKIKNLRSTYLQELAKIRARSKADYTYTPNMKWFAEMDKHCKRLSKYKNDGVAGNKQTDTENNDNNDSSNEEQSIFIWTDFKPDSEPEIDEFQPNLDSALTKKKIKEEVKSIEYLELNPSLSVEGESESGQKDDEFEIYGKYIASQLRRLSTPRALRLKLKIHNLVNEERLADYSDKR